MVLKGLLELHLEQWVVLLIMHIYKSKVMLQEITNYLRFQEQ